MSENMAAIDDNVDSDNTDEVYHDSEYLDNQNMNIAFNSRNNAVNNFDDDSDRKIRDQRLMKACQIGDINLIEEYLDSGHDVNEFVIGWTLLLYAASHAQPKLVQYLLNIGADPNLNLEGYTPLMALCSSPKGKSNSRLQCLEFLIEGKADANASNKMKETPLMYACKMQEIDFVSELLKYVVHINFADSEQRTALFYAVTHNRYDVAKLLIESGADITWTNYRGLTPHDIAVSKGYDEFIPLLTIHDDEEENFNELVNTKDVTDWLDMFPSIVGRDMDSLDSDVVNILYGMGLESYLNCFRGIDLKTFLRLREEDLERLGVDISVHRKKFFDELFRFHQYEWRNSMKFDETQPFSAFETMKVLGNLNKQLSVMSSSLYFSKTCLDSIEDNEESKSNLCAEDREKLKIEMENMQLIALRIKEATEKVRSLAENIKEQNSDLSLPIHIEKKNKKHKHNKWIIITVITLVGIYLFRLKSSKKWYNDEKSSKSWRNIFNFSLSNMLYDKFYRISLFLRND